MSTINYPNSTVNWIQNQEPASESVLNRPAEENKENYDAIKTAVEKGTFDWNLISGTTSLESNDAYMLDSFGGSFTATLPASPSDGDRIAFLNINASLESNNVTIDRNGNNIQGLAEDLILDVDNISFILVFNSNSSDWRLF